ncbi:N-acetyltransferase [Flavobacterium album]|uniref:N-acetyltransferase n=1 Tax=Flavobacterium album TaxID=2175091 RepID=A0A2S1QWB3_9FLAO|nr:GNAT family protein [Flavobacterium album]AWH84521.1 N-acetyltransferase [Flavobacterium album]
MTNWKTDTLADILPEEFYALIDRNRDHIAKTFPGTLANNTYFEDTVAALGQSAMNEGRKENYYYYLRNLDTNALIGYVLVKNIDRKIAKCELAYFIDKDFEGKGIITKAVGNLIAFCFEELHMNKITICTSPVNYGSQRIALKHGFTKEGVLRQEFKNGQGVLEDIFYYGLLRSEYNER